MHMASPLQILLIAIVVLVLFGRGKIASMMGEFGKGITAFKKGVSEGTKDIEEAAAEPKTAETKPLETTPDKDKV